MKNVNLKYYSKNRLQNECFCAKNSYFSVKINQIFKKLPIFLWKLIYVVRINVKFIKSRLKYYQLSPPDVTKSQKPFPLSTTQNNSIIISLQTFERLTTVKISK